MPARLNVVIVQSPRLTSLQSEVTEQVMIELLGRPGIDILVVQSLVGDLHSTDRMALTALENELVIVDWQSEDSIVTQCAALSIVGSSAPHPLNPQPASSARLSPTSSMAAPRRLYCFDLRLGFKAEQVASAILGLLAAKQVQTIRIGNLAPTATRSNANAQAAGTSRVVDSDLTPTAMTSFVSNNSLPATEPYATAVSVEATSQPELSTDFEEEAQLDRLVDGLNNADW